MPRIKLNQQEYMIKDFFKDLSWECKKAGYTQEQQGSDCGCTAQNICYAYKNQSLSLRQYLIIRSNLDEIKKKGG